jgi:hypothetical protein
VESCRRQGAGNSFTVAVGRLERTVSSVGPQNVPQVTSKPASGEDKDKEDMCLHHCSCIRVTIVEDNFFFPFFFLAQAQKCMHYAHTKRFVLESQVSATAGASRLRRIKMSLLLEIQ